MNKEKEHVNLKQLNKLIVQRNVEHRKFTALQNRAGKLELNVDKDYNVIHSSLNVIIEAPKGYDELLDWLERLAQDAQGCYHVRKKEST